MRECSFSPELIREVADSIPFPDSSDGLTPTIICSPDHTPPAHERHRVVNF